MNKYVGKEVDVSKNRILQTGPYFLGLPKSLTCLRREP